MQPRKRRVLEKLLLPAAIVSAIPMLGRFGGQWTSKTFTSNCHKHQKTMKGFSPALSDHGVWYQKTERKWIIFLYLNFVTPQDNGREKHPLPKYQPLIQSLMEIFSSLNFGGGKKKLVTSTVNCDDYHYWTATRKPRKLKCSDDLLPSVPSISFIFRSTALECKAAFCFTQIG